MLFLLVRKGNPAVLECQMTGAIFVLNDHLQGVQWVYEDESCVLTTSFEEKFTNFEAYIFGKLLPGTWSKSFRGGWMLGSNY